MEGIFQLGLDALLLLALLASIYFFVMGSPARGYKAGVRRIAGIAAVMLSIGLLLLLSAVIVPAGHVGVVSEFGRVQSDELQPGLHFRLPFANTVTVVDTRVQGVRFENLAAASREYQDVILTGTLNVHVDQTRASEILQTIGLDYSAKIVVPFYTNLVKEVVPKYTIDQVLPNRETIRKETVEKLTAKLAAYGIIVDDIAIENISFSEAYTAAIEAKQIAQQQVETEKQVTQQRIQQAQQAIEAAKGNAQAAIENAKGTAEANRLLTESLSAILIQYETIRKLNPNVQVVYLPETGNFLLQIPQPTKTP